MQSICHFKILPTVNQHFMRFQTEITIPQPYRKINYLSPIFSIGSCFSTEIGNKLADLKYKVCQNPCGITFNPVSMLSCVRDCFSGISLPEDQHFFHEGMWRNPNFHGSFNDPDKVKHQKRTNDSLANSSEFLKKAQIVLITIGSSFVYRWEKTNQVVNNCHKLPKIGFKRELLDVNVILEALQGIKSLIDKTSTESKLFVITVSPIRHIRDGLIENQRSKARAIEAAHQFSESCSTIQYFPSYEILMDELRDYRFYKEDMIHPSRQAIEFIYNAFENHYLEPSEATLRKQIKIITSGIRHKPLFPDSDKHRLFKSDLINKMELLENSYNYISFKEEKHLLLNDTIG